MKTILKKNKRKVQGIAVALLVAILIFIPFFKTGYIIRFMTTIFLYLALSQIWNILGGFAGYISLGLVGFVGFGAYAAVILMNFGWSFYLAAPAAGLLAALLSAIISLPVLRLKSGYYSIATFGVALVLREIANNMTALTGGGMGVSFPMLAMDINGINTYFYLVMLTLAILIIGLCAHISHASLGYGLMAIKEDEDAANVLGVNTTTYKIIAFCISSFAAAVVGSAYGYWLTFIEPFSSFDTNMSIMVIIMAMVGGAGTVIGPIIGTIVITIISEVLWNNFMSGHQAILGVILIIVVIFMPNGIVDVFIYKQEKFSLRYLKNRLTENISKYKI